MVLILKKIILWVIGLVVVFFGNKKSEISRDSKRAQTDGKYLIFEEGFNII